MPFMKPYMVKLLREQFPPGTRIRLESEMNDPQPIPKGMTGTVQGIDDAGQLLMEWDNGRGLSLIPGEDDFSVVKPQKLKLYMPLELGYYEKNDWGDYESEELTLPDSDAVGYSDTGNAYNMCWDRYCTPKKMEYYHRMLAVRNVKWVGHAMAKGLCSARRSESTSEVQKAVYDVETPGLFTDNLTDNPLWGDVSKCIHTEHTFENCLHGASAAAKVAVLYTWESNAFFNNEQMHYHRASLKALLDKLMTNNIPIDVVPSFETNLSHYDVIFALWPSMMPDPLWQALKQEIAAGKQIYFMGPPAYVTTSGKDISAEFEKLTGSHVTAVKTYFGGYEYPAWDFWFTDKIIPMNIYCEGDEIIERSCGNVHYYGYEAPLTEAMIDVIENLSDYKTIDNDRVISKVYQRSDEKIITLTGRWSCKINMRFAFEGNDIEIQNGTLILISAEKNKITKLLSSGGAQIYINGIRSDYEQI